MYEIEKSNNEFRVCFSATLENIDIADDDLNAYLEEYSCPVDVFAVRILLRESLLNAVLHGSNNNPAKKVSMIVQVMPDSLVIKVTDTGDGFNYSDHNNAINNLEEGGRGLSLMKIYADKVKFNDKGNEVILKKLFKCDNKVAEIG